MSNSTDNRGPDEIIAEKIIARLVKAGLISEQDSSRSHIQLANGNLKAEDWRLLAEKALELKSREDAHGD